MFIVAYVAYEMVILFEKFIYLKNKPFLLNRFCVIDMFIYHNAFVRSVVTLIIVFISILTFCFGSSMFWVWFLFFCINMNVCMCVCVCMYVYMDVYMYARNILCICTTAATGH
jgi:hypothetical protein